MVLLLVGETSETPSAIAIEIGQVILYWLLLVSQEGRFLLSLSARQHAQFIVVVIFFLSSSLAITGLKSTNYCCN